MTGLDTSFFVRLLGRDATALSLWRALEGTSVIAAISCLTLFEMERLALRRVISREGKDLLRQTIPHICHIVWLEEGMLTDAARVSHTYGIPGVDSLILSSLLRAGCRKIIAADTHFMRYAKQGVRIVNLLQE